MMRIYKLTPINECVNQLKRSVRCIRNSQHSHEIRRFASHSGFTAIELLAYTGLLAVISIFLIQSLLTLNVSYRKLQGERDAVSSARFAMETIGREVIAAKAIYGSTSVFAVATGQLSLESAWNPVPGEDTGWVDFYVDNRRLYQKREGSAAVPLTSESVLVDSFTVTRVLTGTRESARVSLKILSALPGNLLSSSTLTASFTPRGNY